MTITYDLTDGSTSYNNGTDEIWYCPGVGPVRKLSEEIEGAETRTSILDLMWAGLEVDLPTH